VILVFWSDGQSREKRDVHKKRGERNDPWEKAELAEPLLLEGLREKRPKERRGKNPPLSGGREEGNSEWFRLSYLPQTFEKRRGGGGRKRGCDG